MLRVITSTLAGRAGRGAAVVEDRAVPSAPAAVIAVNERVRAAATVSAVSLFMALLEGSREHQTGT